MVLMVDLLVLGLLTGLLTGGKLKNLDRVRVRGDWILLAMLLIQSVAPMIVAVKGRSTELLVLSLAWVVPVLVAFVVSAVNWRTPGVVLVAAGLLLNLIPVVLNAGMPVLVDSAAIVGADSQLVAESLESSWLHVAADKETRALYLADVLPIPGPPWHRGMLSLGDVVLSVGAGLAVFAGLHIGDTATEA